MSAKTNRFSTPASLPNFERVLLSRVKVNISKDNSFEGPAFLLPRFLKGAGEIPEDYSLIEILTGELAAYDAFVATRKEEILKHLLPSRARIASRPKKLVAILGAGRVTNMPVLEYRAKDKRPGSVKPKPENIPVKLAKKRLSLAKKKVREQKLSDATAALTKKLAITRANQDAKVAEALSLAKNRKDFADTKGLVAAKVPIAIQQTKLAQMAAKRVEMAHVAGSDAALGDPGSNWTVVIGKKAKKQERLKQVSILRPDGKVKEVTTKTS